MIWASDPKPLPAYLAIGLERVGAGLGIGIGGWWLFGAA